MQTVLLHLGDGAAADGSRAPPSTAGALDETETRTWPAAHPSRRTGCPGASMWHVEVRTRYHPCRWPWPLRQVLADAAEADVRPRVLPAA